MLFDTDSCTIDLKVHSWLTSNYEVCSPVQFGTIQMLWNVKIISSPSTSAVSAFQGIYTIFDTNFWFQVTWLWCLQQVLKYISTSEKTGWKVTRSVATEMYKLRADIYK